MSGDEDLRDVIRLAVADGLDELKAELGGLRRLLEGEARVRGTIEARVQRIERVIDAVVSASRGEPAKPISGADADGEPGTATPTATPCQPVCRPELDLSAIVQAEREGERLATVMFADVVGYTSMSEKLSPEQIRTVMNRVFKPLTAEIERAGGWVEKYIGDCIMAVFGAPVSHGDDASRAAMAALRMQEQLALLGPELEPLVGHRLVMRIGLNTGLVHAGKVGAGQRMAYSVLGDTVNTAKRFEENCPHGGVLISSTTQRQIAERFVTEFIGAIPMKGKSQPVEAHRLLRERSTILSDWTSTVAGRPVPFVGRRHELAGLRDELAAVVNSRHPRCVLVRGPLGIGKTRCIAEFCRLASGVQPVVLLHGLGGGHVEGASLGPVLRAIGQWLEREGPDPMRLLAERWRGSETAGGDGEDDPVLKSLCRWIIEHQQVELDPANIDAERRLLFRSVSELMLKLRPGMPVILVLSDLDNADRTTIECLEWWLDAENARDGYPLLIIGEQHASPDSPAWSPPSAGRFREIVLSTLPDKELRSVCDGLFEREGGGPAWLLDWAVGQSAGNPASLMAHLHSLPSLGILETDPETGAWLLPDAPPDLLALPPGVQTAIQSTIDVLGSNDYLVITVAAVTGAVCWDRLLFRLLAGWLDPAGIERSIAALGERGLVRVSDHPLLPGTREFRFASEPFRQVAAAAVPVWLASAIHGTAADALRALDTDGRLRLLVAGHCRLGNDPAGALDALLLAMAAGIDSGSLSEAGRIALEAEEIVRDEAARLADRLPLLMVRLRVLRAEMNRLKGEYRQASVDLEQASDALHGLDRHDPQAGRWAVRLHLCAGDMAATRGLWQDALARYTDAHRLVDEAGGGIESIHLDIEAGRCWALLKMARPDEAERILDEHLERYDDRVLIGLPIDIMHGLARLYDTRGEIRRQRRDLAAARNSYERARLLREPSGNPRLISVSENNLAMVEALAGNWATAARRFERILAIRKGWGAPKHLATVRFNLAECQLRSGRLDEGRANLDQVRTEATGAGWSDVLKEVEQLEREFPPATTAV